MTSVRGSTVKLISNLMAGLHNLVTTEAFVLGAACGIAPEAKLNAIRRYGADIVKVPYDEWWEIMTTRYYAPLADALFIHPSSDPRVMAGNGTIGLEILEDLPDLDAVIIPWGSGGLSNGIASAGRALKPNTNAVCLLVERNRVG